MSWREIEDMPIDLANEYDAAINILEAKEALRLCRIADFPTLKDKSREDYWEQLFNTATQQEKQVKTFAEAAKELGQYFG
jgi:hypothetical protein